MKKTLKVISLLLSLVFILSSCANGGLVPTEDLTQSENEINEKNTSSDGKTVLAYNKTDGLNPFFAKSYENLYICELLYDSLFEADSNYNVAGKIASAINTSATTATVTLRTDAVCHGSANINADDVVYSFNLAKTSFGWSGNLTNVLSATAIATDKVQFELEYADIYVSGKLDFPIVKVGTAADSSSVPTGSGDYYFSDNTLISRDGSNQIYLCETGTNESAENAFKIGRTDVYFSDLSDCSFSAVFENIQNVQLNNMVYIGINSSRGALNKYVRSAIAAKLDCEDIALSAYQGHATAAKLPVNPASVLKTEISQISVTGNKETADNILDYCGYTRYSGETKTNGAYPLAMTLIVNKENNYRVAAAYAVAESLKESGFTVTVLTLDFSDYSQRITSGNYDMYIGEIKLDSTFDISEFFKQGTSFSAGTDFSSRAVTEYFRYRAGEITAAEYYDIFIEEYPFVPVCFRMGYAVNSYDVKLDFAKIPFNLYSGI